MFDYDPETGVLTWRVRLANSTFIGQEAGTESCHKGKTYRHVKAFGKRYVAHRIIFLWKTGDWPPYEIDHEDGNGLNNRWSNLKPKTHLENSRNQRKPSNNSSGVIGVNWNKESRKWKSYIYSNGSQIHLGSFTNKVDAIAARKAAEAELNFHPNHGSDRPL